MSGYTGVLLKAVLYFFWLLFMTRLMGRKQISQLTFFDYITGITIGSMAATVCVDRSLDIKDGLITIFTWAALSIAIGYANLKNLFLRRATNSRAAIIIENGRIMIGNMRTARYNMEDLLMQLRLKDVFDLSEVQYAVLEPNGELSVLKRSMNSPATPKDLGITVADKGMMVNLIMDGKVIEENLYSNNLSIQWLRDELKKKNISSAGDVIFAGIGTDGKLEVILKSADSKN